MIIEEPKLLGGLGEMKSNNGTQYFQQDRVYSSDGIAMCHPANIPGGSYKYCMEEIKVLGNYHDSNHDASRVVDTNGVAPTVKENHGTVTGILEPTIVASRGRNPQKPSDRTPGIHTEQRLEMNKDGVSNTLTSVNKDNLVLQQDILAIDEQNMNVRKETFETITADGSSPKHNNRVMIKQATKQGYIECEVGGIFDGSYPDSETRRGRVQENGNISPTLTADGSENLYRVEKPSISRYRIRKLTPRECGRLMGVSDEDITKMLEVNSNSQCYKQFGNSIVVPVMEAMFRNLNIKGVSND